MTCDVVTFSRLGVISTSPKPQAGVPPFVGCPRLLIQYIRSYPPYLQAQCHAVVTESHLAQCHAVVTGTHLAQCHAVVTGSHLAQYHAVVTGSHISLHKILLRNEIVFVNFVNILKCIVTNEQKEVQHCFQ